MDYLLVQNGKLPKANVDVFGGYFMNNYEHYFNDFDHQEAARRLYSYVDFTSFKEDMLFMRSEKEAEGRLGKILDDKGMYCDPE